MRAGGRQERGGDAERPLEEVVAGPGELAVAGEMAARDGPAHVLHLPPRQAGPVEGDRQGGPGALKASTSGGSRGARRRPASRARRRRAARGCWRRASAPSIARACPARSRMPSQSQSAEEPAAGLLGGDRADAVVPERDPVTALDLRRLLPRRVADDGSAALRRQDPVRPSFHAGADPLLVDAGPRRRGESSRRSETGPSERRRPAGRLRASRPGHRAWPGAPARPAAGGRRPAARRARSRRRSRGACP